MIKFILNTTEVWWMIITLLCCIGILYILAVKIKGAELFKAIVVSLIFIIVITSIWSQVLLREQVPKVYVNLPEEWQLISNTDTDTLVVSLNPTKDTMYTSFMLRGFTDSEVEQEIDSIHEKWLEFQESK